MALLLSNNLIIQRERQLPRLDRYVGYNKSCFDGGVGVVACDVTCGLRSLVVRGVDFLIQFAQNGQSRSQMGKRKCCNYYLSLVIKLNLLIIEIVIIEILKK